MPGDNGKRELTAEHGAFAPSCEANGQVGAPGRGESPAVTIARAHVDAWGSQVVFYLARD
jgi:hypothetical protein